MRSKYIKVPYYNSWCWHNKPYLICVGSHPIMLLGVLTQGNTNKFGEDIANSLKIGCNPEFDYGFIHKRVIPTTGNISIECDKGQIGLLTDIGQKGLDIADWIISILSQK